MALLTRIEEFISTPMELFHKQKGFQPVDLNRMALRQMESGCRKGIRQTYAPNHFNVRLNPADLKDLSPFLDVIRSEISGELRRVVTERKYLLAGDLAVEIVSDQKSPQGQPRVEARMQGSSTDGAEEPEKNAPSCNSPRGMRDAKTVLAVPGADDSTTVDAVFEERNSRLKAATANEDLPEFQEGSLRSHAALLLAMEMMNHRRASAKCSQQEVPRRIEWKKHPASPAEPRPEPSEVLGRLFVRGEGLVLHVTGRGIFLECENQTGPSGDSPWALLENGGEVRVGDSVLEYQAVPRPAGDNQTASISRQRVIRLPGVRNEKDV